MMKDAWKLCFFLLFLQSFYIKQCFSIPPIMVLGNKLYNSKTGERFIMKGLTYEYAIDDEFYNLYGETVFDQRLQSIQGYYNTIRLYNINPDKSYKLFMKKMEALNVYVFASGTPDNVGYFEEYRYASMRKDLGPNGRTSTCYPAKLLEYGKKIAKNFAQYDNTLGIIVGNEIMQTNLVPAACVKQYTADLKNWMRSYAKKMRILPLAYAAADSAYSPDSLHVDADNYGPLKILGLLCGDVMKNGRMLSSIDIYLLNTYRWCGKSTYVAGFSRMVEWAQGLPIVIALGEYGCRQPSDPPRTWDMITYLSGDNTDGQNMTSIYSGGIAYSYGEANLGTDSLFPMFTGGSQALDGQPSMKKTVDYDNFAAQLQKHQPLKEVAEWDTAKKCAWTPPISSKPAVSNKFVIDNNGWIADTCDNVVPGNGDKPIWSTTSRQGAACANDGSPCEVVISSTYSSTEEQLCGVVIETNGGGKCSTSNDCGKNGICVLIDGIYTCQCINDYSGPSCNIIDLDKRGVISSNNNAPKKIFILMGCILGAVLIFFTIIFIRSKALVAENQKFEQIVGKQSTGGQIQQTASL